MHDWRAEWGYQALFSCCSSRKAGVMILFNNNITFQILRTYCDPEGRFIICDMTTNGKQLTLVNLYAPNDDDPNFFTSVFENLADFQSDEVVIGGDYNLVLDVEKDKKGGLAKTHKKSLEVLNKFSEDLDLVDVWRVQNPESQRFTWRQRNPEIHCRLDFFLVNNSILCSAINTDIVPGYKTDHSMITLQISLHNNPRGRGFWKLNTSFLKDEEYVNQIREIIAQTKDEYAQDDTVTPGLLWEMIKMKTREASINYGKTKKRNLEQKKDEIEKLIKILEEQIANTHENDSQKLWPELEKKRFELEAIIEYQTKGAILRSKSQWYNEGEKNSKYFLNLEKRHCRQNTITQLKINDMDVIQSDKEILHDCEDFYKNLYSSKMQVNNSSKDFFPQARQVLSNENLYFCEGPLSSKECLEALKSMASEKSPGTDGLPSEFYKVFWEEIGESLTSALNSSFEIGQLPVSQRRGIIKLIPKKDGDPNLI